MTLALASLGIGLLVIGFSCSTRLIDESDAVSDRLNARRDYDTWDGGSSSEHGSDF